MVKGQESWYSPKIRRGRVGWGLAGILEGGVVVYCLAARQLGAEGILLAHMDRGVHGQVPYRDVHVGYGPALYWAHAVVFAWWGVSTITVGSALALVHDVREMLLARPGWPGGRRPGRSYGWGSASFRLSGTALAGVGGRGGARPVWTDFLQVGTDTIAVYHVPHLSLGDVLREVDEARLDRTPVLLAHTAWFAVLPLVRAVATIVVAAGRLQSRPAIVEMLRHAFVDERRSGPYRRVPRSIP